MMVYLKMNAMDYLVCALMLSLLLSLPGCLNKKEATGYGNALRESRSANHSPTSTSTTMKRLDGTGNVTAYIIGNLSADSGTGSEDNSSILDAVLNTIDQSGSDANESDDELDRLMDEIDRM